MPNKYLVLRDRSGMLAPTNWVPLATSLSMSLKFFAVKPIVITQIYHQKRVIAVYEQSEFDRIKNEIGEKLFSSKDSYENIKTEISKREEVLYEFLNNLKNKKIENLNLNELIDLAFDIKKKYLHYESVNLPAWFFGVDGLAQRIKETLKIPENDFLSLSTPNTKTTASQLENEILKSLQRIFEKESEIKKEAHELSEKFGALPHGFDGMDYWNKKYFVDKLEKEIKEDPEEINKKIDLIHKQNKNTEQKIKEIIKKHKLNDYHLELINRLNQAAIWTDERRLLTYKMYYYYHLIIIELEKKCKIPFDQLKHLFTDELIMLKNDLEKAKKISEQRIKEEVVIDFENGKYYLRSGAEKNKFLDELKKQKKPQDLKGSVASKGPKNIYQGRAKILLSAKEGDKIEAGDFLIATMTTPDYIMSMHKAAGFITDEGGVTCHAAIVAREMNKPCIIATKIATKKIKDNDKIEINTKSGEIKILN